jgi:hypothetical protein
MNKSTLNQIYNELREKHLPGYTPANIGYNSSGTKRLAHRTQAVKFRDSLQESCAKYLLLDLYMRVLPFDPGYADGNRGMCRDDVDSFLNDKRITATQYFHSAYDATKAPLLEYVLRSIENIGKAYMEKANDAAEDDIPPPSVEDEEIEELTVEIKKDDEYESFISELKKKTINKIVNDISALINDKKTDMDMIYAPATEGKIMTGGAVRKVPCRSVRRHNGNAEESAFTVAFEYISESLIKGGTTVPADDMTALAIRESTLNILDCVFEQEGHRLEHFARKIRMGNGIIVNKTGVRLLTESNS